MAHYKNSRFRIIDHLLFAATLLFLIVVISSAGSANIQTDAVDYYSILQRLVQPDEKPIVSTLHFVDQRSPGYPILALPAYYLLTWFVEPWQETQQIYVLANDSAESRPRPPAGHQPTPSNPISLQDVPFKDYYIKSQDSWFKWKIVAPLLLTSYTFLFVGIAISIKTIALIQPSPSPISLTLLLIITAPIFMQNIVKTPVYATLTAFGISALFTYFFCKGYLQAQPKTQFLAGLFLGLLVLTRLETILIAIVIFCGLLIIKAVGFARNLLSGASISLVILLIYNWSQFGNPIYMGILKGDINLIRIDSSYMLTNLFDPRSGIFIWSALTMLGILGLFWHKHTHLRLLAFGTLLLLILILLRIPVMYVCMGDAVHDLDGFSLPCLPNQAAARQLIRSDANRYITVIIPFAVLGISNLLSTWGKRRLNQLKALTSRLK